MKGKAAGITEGKAAGLVEGETKGQMAMLELFHQLGLISDEQYQIMAQPLRQKLAKLTRSASSEESPSSQV